jgi:hypothetical protein
VLTGLAGFIVVLVGVFRLAKPESWWARRYYGEEKMLQSRARYAHAPAERVRASDELQQRVVSEAFGFECRICGEAFESQVDAEHHVRTSHAGSAQSPGDAVQAV